MHVFAVRATPFVRGDAPRERNDVNAEVVFTRTLPLGVLVVNDPLQTVHGGFVELLFDDVVLKGARSKVGADTDIDQISIRGRTVKLRLRAAGVHAGCCRHAHASRAVLVTVVGVVGSVGFSGTARHTDWVGVNVTHRIKPGNEFLVQTGVLVVHTRVDHGDVDAFSRDAQIPCTHGIDAGIHRLHGWRLDITVQHHTTVLFHHGHIVQLGNRWCHGSINEAQEHCIHGVDDVGMGNTQCIKREQVVLCHRYRVRDPHADGPGGHLKMVVNAVAVEVKGGSLPPRRLVRDPNTDRLVRHVECSVDRTPEKALFIHGDPIAAVVGLHQGAGQWSEQQAHEQESNEMTHKNPSTRPPRHAASTCWRVVHLFGPGAEVEQEGAQSLLRTKGGSRGI